MSEQFNPIRTLQPELDRARKGRRDRKEPYGIDDFPVGSVFVAQHTAYAGLQGAFLCEVVEIYETRLVNRWRRGGVCLIARILDVTLQIDVGLIGRLFSVSLDTGSWSWANPTVCAWTVAEFERSKEPARRRAQA